MERTQIYSVTKGVSIYVLRAESNDIMKGSTDHDALQSRKSADDEKRSSESVASEKVS